MCDMYKPAFMSALLEPATPCGLVGAAWMVWGGVFVDFREPLCGLYVATCVGGRVANVCVCV